MARDSTIGIALDHAVSGAEEVFGQLLDRSAISLAPENVSAFDVPADELHQEILLPLLPAMLGDGAIRVHWQEQKSAGFFARLQANLNDDAPPPQWSAEDFAIHVTASYSAGPDARALADTLLSEDGLRDLTAALMNKVLEALWPELLLLPPSSPALAASAESKETDDLEDSSLSEQFSDETARGHLRPRPDEVLTKDIAEITAEPPFIASVGRHLLVRPQPWNPRRNPLAGTRNDIPCTFRNVLLSNPLETRLRPSRIQTH